MKSQDMPSKLQLTALMQIETRADPGGPVPNGKPARPRFGMVAYTGGTMQVAGWRYMVVVDLAGQVVVCKNAPTVVQTSVGRSRQLRAATLWRWGRILPMD